MIDIANVSLRLECYKNYTEKNSSLQFRTIYKKIIHNGLSVRKVEELVNNTKPEIKPSTNVNKYEQQQLLLEQKLGRKVKITAKKLTISFKNEEELNRLIELLS